MMKLLRWRPLFLILLVVIVAPACEFSFEGADDTQPTAIVITSTPTESSSGGVPTSTEAGTPAPSETEAPDDDPTVAPGSPTATESASTATEEETPPNDNQAVEEIEAIEADVVDLRGLDLLEDLDEQIIDRQELARRVEEILEEEYSAEDARIDALTYWLLRLIPDGSLDLYQLQVDLLSEQIAGYYDPETKELVVVTEDGTLGVLDKVTMAHEIVHALQDQHFDLNKIDELAIDADHDAAITALVEGDATLSMTEYMFSYLDPVELIELLGESFAGADSDVLDNAPRYISDGLLFSYDDGQAFATALFNEGGYEAIDAAFSDPPKSTEQILHPEKYLAADRDDPMFVDNPDLSGDLGSDWELLRGDVLGEWDLRIMLEDNGVSSTEASSAAAGWGGSWFDIYESETGAVALLTTRWDTNEDADEFASALLGSFDGDAENGGLWQESGRFFSVISSGDTVVMISGTNEAAVETARSTIEQTV